MGPIVVPILWLCWKVMGFAGSFKKDPDNALWWFLYMVVSIPLMYWAGFFDELLRRLAP